jgi:hypothetical protein
MRVRLRCWCRDGKHVVFGSVVEGLDVVKKVEGYGEEPRGGGGGARALPAMMPLVVLQQRQRSATAPAVLPGVVSALVLTSGGGWQLHQTPPCC